jgi:hypothetical protein
VRGRIVVALAALAAALSVAPAATADPVTIVPGRLHLQVVGWRVVTQSGSQLSSPSGVSAELQANLGAGGAVQIPKDGLRMPAFPIDGLSTPLTVAVSQTDDSLGVLEGATGEATLPLHLLLTIDDDDASTDPCALPVELTLGTGTYAVGPKQAVWGAPYSAKTRRIGLAGTTTVDGSGCPDQPAVKALTGAGAVGVQVVATVTVVGPVSTPPSKTTATTTTTTTGVTPPPAAKLTLPTVHPTGTVHPSHHTRAKGRLTTISGLSALPSGVTAKVSCTSRCTGTRTGRVDRSGRLRLTPSITVVSGSRLRLTLGRSGYRTAVVALLVRQRKGDLVLRAG